MGVTLSRRRGRCTSRSLAPAAKLAAPVHPRDGREGDRTQGKASYLGRAQVAPAAARLAGGDRAGSEHVYRDYAPGPVDYAGCGQPPAVSTLRKGAPQ